MSGMNSGSGASGPGSTGGGRRLGSLDLGVLRTLYGHELRMLVRDRRTVMIAVLAPLILFPIMIFGMRAIEEREQKGIDETVFRYAVVGSEAPVATELVDAAVALAPDSAAGLEPARFEWVREGEAEALLREGELHLVVEGELSGEGGSGDDPAETVTGGGPGDEVVGGGPVELRLRYRASSDRSSAASSRMRERLEVVRAEQRDATLLEGGFPVVPEEIAVVASENVASAEKEGGALLGMMLTPLLVMFLFMGGTIVAVDAIAGEKERGTLEALLTTAARRGEIVASKQLAVVTVGLAIMVINVANLYAYLVTGVVDLPANLAVAVSPAAVLVVLLLFMPLVVLVSSTLLLASGYAKSYKEYQLYFTPLLLVALLPSAAAVMPGLSLRSAIVIVPMANVSVAVREVLTGRFDWFFLLVAFLTTVAVAAWLARVTSRFLSTERLISASELDRAELLGGPALFPRRVLRWFAVMWALLLVAGLWMGNVGIRGQVFVNLFLIFLGGTVLMVRRYRLDLRETFALRLPRPSVWLAVLIGAPSALIVGQGLAELAGVFIPVPEEMIEAFGQYMLDDLLPLWQVVLFMAIVPGIVEELAFRGALLHGLRRRFSPVVLTLVVGLIFGLFHVSIFRIIPTGYLGVVFAAVVLLTGSIYPAMLWHALNNALVLVPAYLGWTFVEEIPGWAYGVGAIGLAVAFAILWRVRTPYPGLRSVRPEEGAGIVPAGAAVV